MYAVYESAPDRVLEPAQERRVVHEAREADRCPRRDEQPDPDRAERDTALPHSPRRREPHHERPEEDLRRERDTDAAADAAGRADRETATRPRRARANPSVTLPVCIAEITGGHRSSTP